MPISITSVEPPGRRMMLRTTKLAALGAAKRFGAHALVRKSRWRRERLLILCYHGVSLADEHRWDPELYIPGELLDERLLAIRGQGYNVLPLADALRRLYAGELPPQSVCLTFDDGFHDFRAVAYPLLQKHGMPATVYLTSFYSGFGRPVFDLMCSYLLWRARDSMLESTRFGLDEGRIALTDRGERQRVAARIRRFASDRELSAGQKDELLRALASHLGIDYEALVASRLLQIMSATEIAELDPQLVQIELHTHRHRVPLSKGLFEDEIRQNRDYIRRARQSTSPAHFCYPSGVTSPKFLPWLREAAVHSATTCRPGLASRADDPLMLPRFLDMCSVTADEFEAWLAGIGSKIPRRRLAYPEATANGILT